MTIHTAEAFDGVAGGVSNVSIGDNGNCIVSVRQFNLRGNGAQVLIESGGAYYSPDGVSYVQDSRDEDNLKLTLAIIDSCFTGTVSDFEATAPAAGTSYADADYLGFKFKVDGQAYEYALKGASSTQVIQGPQGPAAPTIDISSAKSSLKAGETAPITFTLSEASTDFEAGDVSATGGTLSGFTGSGTSYSATFTPATDSIANGTISVAENAFTSTATSTANTAGDSLSLSIDTVTPTVMVGSSKNRVAAGGSTTLTFTLSEAATDFAVGDVSITGGTLSNFTGSGTSYSATATLSGASMTASVANGTFSDAAGNLNADGADANNSVTITADSVVPTIAVTSDKSQVAAGGAVTLTFTLSEAATDFAAGDVNVTGGTLSSFTGSGTSYSATATLDMSSASMTASVADGAFSDEAGNLNADGADANNSVTITADSVAPTIALSADKASIKAGETTLVTFTLSEAATDFAVDDISVTGGSISGFNGSGTSYTAIFTPTANSKADGVISVASNKFSDAVGNFNTDGSDANNKLTLTVNTFPAVTVSIEGAPERHANKPFGIIVEFSEAVTGFEAQDITLGNGNVSDFHARDGSTYDVTITPSSDANVTIDIAAAIAKSQNDVDNQAASQVVVQRSLAQMTRKKIRSFMQNRATTILNHQPSLSGFLDGSNLQGGGPLGALGLSANEQSMDLAFSSSLSRIRATRRANDQAGQAHNGVAAIDQVMGSGHHSSYAPPSSAAANNKGIENIEALDGSKSGKPSSSVPHAFPEDRFDVWTQLYASRSRLDQSKADALVAYLGAHYFVNPNLIVGAVAQYDHVSEKNGSSSMKGDGWMAGPYIAGRLPGQSLLYEARVAWGQSNNRIAPIGTFEDSFDTTRWLATGQIKGDITLTSLDQMTRIAFNPFIRATYFEETQEGYVDGNGTAIEEQTYSVGQIAFGPKITLETELENGLHLAPFLSASGLWDFELSEGDASQTSALQEGDLRARFDAGLGIKTADDWMLNVSSFYDGVGVANYHSYGGKLRLTIPLN